VLRISAMYFEPPRVTQMELDDREMPVIVIRNTSLSMLL